MPIKLPRFPRRKSIGNALDGATYEPADPESPGSKEASFSFETIDRNLVTGSVGDKTTTISSTATPNYPSYSTHLRYGDSTGSSSASRSNSNSGGSNGYYASDRQSSSSTLPSTSEMPRTPNSQDEAYKQQQQYQQNEFVRAESPAYVNQNAPPKTSSSTKATIRGAFSRRDKSHASQESSSTTNTMSSPIQPPKIEAPIDSDSLFGEDMFKFTADGKRMSAIGLADSVVPKVASNTYLTNSKDMPIAPVPPPRSMNSSAPQSRRFLDSRIHGDDDDVYVVSSNSRNQFEGIPSLPTPSANIRQPGSPPTASYPWDAKADESQGLMSAMSPGLYSPPNQKGNTGQGNSRNLTPAATFHVQQTNQDDNLAPSRPTRPRHQTKNSFEGVRRSPGTNGKRASTQRPLVDKDASTISSNVVRRKEVPYHVDEADSAPRNPIGQTFKRTQTEPTVSNSDSLFDGLKSKKSAAKLNSAVAETDYENLYSGDFTKDAMLARKYQEKTPVPQIPQAQQQAKKVMTKAQFESYRVQQDRERQLAKTSGENDDSDDDSVVSDDEVSEDEKRKAAAKQRLKQDAHLAVYRQQMMKITGSQPSDLPPLGMSQRQASNSTPILSLTNGMPKLSVSGPSSHGGRSDDEDEEVPLGILMAHGFPNKASNRPPTRLSNSSSQPNLRSVSQTHAQDGGRLPPFARHLPADPYFGAGLVNASNRATMHSFQTGMSAAGSSYGDVPPSIPAQRHGGLIGEIVRDEEMRASRRGHQYSTSGGLPPQSVAPQGGNGLLGLGGGFGRGGMPIIQAPQPSQNDQYQMQMANQMTQMMQMQMQWMQQMQSLQNMGQGMMPMPQMQMPMPMPGGYNPMQMQSSMTPPPPMAQPNTIRPIPSHSQSMGLLPGQRTLSMVDPVMQAPFQQGLSPNYTPSIHGGQPHMFPQPGYTPSIAPSERSNIGHPSRYRPVTLGNSNGSNRSSTMTSANPAAPLSNNSKAAYNNAKLNDSDDEEGWTEMEKKRRVKKETWRRKKESQQQRGTIADSRTSPLSTPVLGTFL